MILFQTPNLPLKIAIICFILRFFVSGVSFEIVSMIYVSALIYWSLLEMAFGVNNFRKLLGWTVFVFQVYSQFSHP